MEILFSIVVPTYNRGHLLPALLESFTVQRYSNFELIVVDDGGSDNTQNVVEQYADPRFRYTYKENGERGAARNCGMQMAKGDYINFFDSDDIAFDNHLSIAIEVIRLHNRPPFFYTGFEVRSPDGKVLSLKDDFKGNAEEECIKKKRVSINSLFVRRDIALEHPFSEIRALSASEDALFLCQIACRYPARCDKTPTTAVIEHDQRSMTTAKENQILDRKKILIQQLNNDEVFMSKHSHLLPYIEGEFNYMLTLSCLINKNKGGAFKYFLSFIRKNPSGLFSKRLPVFLRWILK